MSTAEVRTQVYLPRKLHRALKRAARQRGESMAALLRQAAEAIVREQELACSDPLDELIGAAKKGPADLSEKHDEYLYGPTEKTR